MNLVERVKLKIKELIEIKKISIYELAEKADLTEACIHNWYTKRNYTPSLEAMDNRSVVVERNAYVEPGAICWWCSWPICLKNLLIDNMTVYQNRSKKIGSELA